MFKKGVSMLKLNKFFIVFLSFVILICNSSISQDSSDKKNGNQNRESLSFKYSFEALIDAAPAILPQDQIIQHTAINN